MKKRPKSFEELLNFEHRWPKLGDRLLRRSDDWNRGVDFSTDALAKHAHLWNGYMSAGAGLVELCLMDEHQSERYTVIYPILYNYRHGLELAMKWIIVMYGGSRLQGFQEGHDLWKLWKRCKEISVNYGAPDDESEEIVERIVKEFHDLDKNGITFRYGWSNDGKTIKLPNHMIDLENIRDVMNGVSGYFEGLDGLLSDLSSAGPVGGY